MTTNPGLLEESRRSLHRLAEHVLSPARYAVTGHIGLLPAPEGLRTPGFGDQNRVLEVALDELVLRQAGDERRVPVTTLRAAAAFAQISAGLPAHVYPAATPCDLDAPLELDPGAMQVLARWYSLGAEALAELAARRPDGRSVVATLWPEHLDYAITVAAVNFGVSPGDASIPEPYAYVGPHASPPDDGAGFWNAPFGAARTMRAADSAQAVLAFFYEGQARLGVRSEE